MDSTEYEPYDIYTQNTFEMSRAHQYSSRPAGKEVRVRPSSAAQAKKGSFSGKPKTTRPQSGKQGYSSQQQIQQQQQGPGSPSTFAVGPRPPSANYNKIIPKFITKDKERLYEDSLHLKDKMNMIVIENNRLIARNNQLEGENAKLGKIIEGGGNSIYYNNRGALANKSETSLIVALKNNIKELKNQLSGKDEELANIKKALKYTKIQEMEIEARTYAEEINRLKAIVEVSNQIRAEEAEMRSYGMTNMEERYYAQNQTIENLRLDNTELAAAIKILQDDMASMISLREVSEKSTTRQSKEIQKLRAMLTEKDKEIDDLKSELTEAQLDGELGQRESDIRERLHETESALHKKNDQIHLMDQTISDLKARLQSQTIQDRSEKQSMKNEMKRLKDDLLEWQQKYTLLLNQQDAMVKSIEENHSRVRPTPDNDDQGHHHGHGQGREQMRPVSGSKKKLAKVKTEDVRSIGLLVQLRMKAQKITYDDAESYFFTDRMVKKGRVSISELEEILKGEPFRLREEGQALLAARYMVEDNKEEYVLLDKDKTVDVSMLRSIFKNFLGKYVLLTEAEEKKINRKTTRLITKYKVALRQYLNNKPTAKLGYVSAADIKKSFKEMDIEIQAVLYDYLVLRLFECSDSIEKLDLGLLFKYFVDDTLAPRDDDEEEGQPKEEYEDDF